MLSYKLLPSPIDSLATVPTYSIVNMELDVRFLFVSRQIPLSSASIVPVDFFDATANSKASSNKLLRNYQI